MYWQRLGWCEDMSLARHQYHYGPLIEDFPIHAFRVVTYAMAKQDSTQCLALKFRELPAAEVGARLVGHGRLCLSRWSRNSIPIDPCIHVPGDQGLGRRSCSDVQGAACQVVSFDATLFRDV